MLPDILQRTDFDHCNLRNLNVNMNFQVFPKLQTLRQEDETECLKTGPVYQIKSATNAFTTKEMLIALIRYEICLFNTQVRLISLFIYFFSLCMCNFSIPVVFFASTDI